MLKRRAQLLNDLENYFAYDDFEERMRWLVEEAERPLVGFGSSRAVFVYDSKNVLKVAMNQAGISQNQAELELSTDPALKPVFPQIGRFASDFSWMVVEEAGPLHTANAFKKLTGVSFEDYSTLISASGLYAGHFRSAEEVLVKLEHLSRGQGGTYPYADLVAKARNNPFIVQMMDLTCQGKLLSSDLERYKHYGVTRDQRLVVLDYGFSPDTWNAHYRGGRPGLPYGTQRSLQKKVVKYEKPETWPARWKKDEPVQARLARIIAVLEGS